MNRKKLTDRIFEDWGQKVVCIVLAVIIYVFSQVATLERKVFVLPLKVEADGLMMASSDIPKFVKVSVRTRAENMPSINSGNIFAYINLSEYTEPGFCDVPVKVSLSEDLMLIDPLEYSVKPAFLNIELDKKELAYIPVKPAISGTVEHGYVISNIDVSPSTVKVVGPSKMINNTTSIDTKKVIVSGAATNFSREVKLDNINSKLKVVPESDFRVTVSVIPAMDTKEYKNITPYVENLNPDFELSGELSKINFKATAAVSVLENFSCTAKTVSVNCAEINAAGTYNLPVNISLPKNMTLVEKSSDTVSVTVVEKIKEQQEIIEDEKDDDFSSGDIIEDKITVLDKKQ